MKLQEWHAAGKIAPQALGSARLQAHNAVQWIARLAHSYLPHKADDAHLDLFWNKQDGALIGRDIGGDLSVGLDVAELTMEFREGGRRSPHRLVLEGHSPAEVEAWFLIELLHRHCDRDRFSKALPFEITGLMSGDNIDFMQEAHAAELAELARWQANAAATLKTLADGKAPIVCSPYHFDIAVVLPVEGRTTAAVRVGLVPGDERLPEPYFYVAKGAVLQPMALTDVPRIGRTQTRDMAAQVLPVSEVAAGAPGAEQVLRFLRSGVAECRRQLAQ